MKLKEIYYIAVPENKRKEERFNVWVSLVVRPLSVLFTKPLLKTRIKPTLITAISILCSVAGFVVLFVANNLCLKLIGWFLFFLWAILDGVDGNYARCSNQCSQMGDLWDTTGGYAAMVLMYFASGVMAFYDNNLVEFMDSYCYLIIGGATAVFSIFPRLVLHKKKSYGNEQKGVNELSNKHQFGLTQIIAMNLISPSGFMQVIFLLCIIFKLNNLFIITYAIINFLVMGASLFKLLRE